MLSLFKNLFKKKNPFDHLHLINNKIMIEFKYCEILNLNNSRIPKYKDESIYSDLISELEYENNNKELLVYRVYNKDDFIQLQYTSGVLTDALYANNKKCLGNYYFNNNTQIINQEILINDEKYKRDLYSEHEYLEPILLKEKFKLKDYIETSNFTIFYKDVEDDLDEFEDSLLYFELKNEELYMYSLHLIDVNKISINSN